MLELNPEQQRALDRAPSDVPARVVDPSDGRTEVILRRDNFDWIRGLLGDEPDALSRVDSRTGVEYVLVPEPRYERFKSFFEEDPLTPAEKRALLREAGKRAGWDSAVWDAEEQSRETA